jgi:hypothetical protein
MFTFHLDHIKFGLHSAFLVEPYRDPKLPPENDPEFGPSSVEFFTMWSVERNSRMMIRKIVAKTGRKMLCTAMDITTATERKKIVNAVTILKRKQAARAIKQKKTASAKREK